jgi:protocatechuate 3,4-dioxygenase alpha subunit
MLLLTPPQTVGPFFAVLVPDRGTLVMVTDQTPGRRIAVEGSVRDGVGQPVPDALVEIWQANAEGHCNHPDDRRRTGPDATFDGFGRTQTDAAGRFLIETITPGAVPGPAGAPQAPHLAVGLFARGLLGRLVTRIYFADDPANAHDPILSCVPADRRPTLIAERCGKGRYRFEIVLQGPCETVFFDV